MNKYVTLYKWVQSGASIHLARIVGIERKPGTPGQEAVKLEIKIEHTLWGEPGEPVRICSLTRHLSETTRLKFPDPIWGRVEIQEGAYLLFVTQEPTQIVQQPVYVEQYYDSQDTVLRSIYTVLEAEKASPGSEERLSRYFQWLQAPNPVPVLFAGEALATDKILLPVDKNGQFANAFASSFNAQSDYYVKISVGTWMWDDIFPRTNAQGEVVIINTILSALLSPSEEVREFAMDRLLTMDNLDTLKQTGVMRSEQVADFLRQQVSVEATPEDMKRINELVRILAP